VLERLLAKSVLLLGYDTPVLVLHELALLEAAARVVRRAMPDLSVRADGALCATHLRAHGKLVVLAAHLRLARAAATSLSSAARSAATATTHHILLRVRVGGVHLY